MFEEKFFAKRKVNTAKLLAYGFTEKENAYHCSVKILEGQFDLQVFIAWEGKVTTQVIETATNEEYTLYRVETAVGSYVGEVRAACETVLMDIFKNCYEPDIFHSEQALAMIGYVREKYGDELEFLWEKFSENAIWRRKDNQKWYGLMIAISGRKLGLDSDKIVEAVDLRLDPSQMAETIDHKSYFPGWHMNKKSWYTVLLDGSVPTEELCRRIDDSYRLAVK